MNKTIMPVICYKLKYNGKTTEFDHLPSLNDLELCTGRLISLPLYQKIVEDGSATGFCGEYVLTKVSPAAINPETKLISVPVAFMQQLQAELWQTLEDEPVLALGNLPSMIDTINAMLEASPLLAPSECKASSCNSGLINRLEQALDTVINGKLTLTVPARETDVDVVIADTIQFLKAQVPGFVMVPVEPTEDQILAALVVVGGMKKPDIYNEVKEIYKRMLEKATCNNPLQAPLEGG